MPRGRKKGTKVINGKLLDMGAVNEVGKSIEKEISSFGEAQEKLDLIRALLAGNYTMHQHLCIINLLQ